MRDDPLCRMRLINRRCKLARAQAECREVAADFASLARGRESSGAAPALRATSRAATGRAADGSCDEATAEESLAGPLVGRQFSTMQTHLPPPPHIAELVTHLAKQTNCVMLARLRCNPRATTREDNNAAN